jgi:ABC-type lipoprotein export system ATPase subunit
MESRPTSAGYDADERSFRSGRDSAAEAERNVRRAFEIADLRFSYADPADQSVGRVAAATDPTAKDQGLQFSLHIPRLEIRAGERVAIIGPSGCGKTTLLALLTGILVPRSGQVVVAGREISSLGDAQRRRLRITRMGLVFQSLALVDYLNVLDNLLHCYRITNALRLDGEVRSRAQALAAELGIGDKLRRPVGALSQGERQRVAIGRALLTKPEILLADEATGNLDPANKGRILDLLFAQQDRDRSTLVAVTHDHELLPRFDRVVDFRELCAT